MLNRARHLLFLIFRWTYRIGHPYRYRLTASGRLLAVLLVCSLIFAINTHETQAYQLACLLLSLFLIAGLSLPRNKLALNAIRMLPDTANNGEILTYHCLLLSHSPKTLHNLFVLDELHLSFPDFDTFLEASQSDHTKYNFFDRFTAYPKLLALIRQRRGGFAEPGWIDTLPAKSQTQLDLRLYPQRRGYLEFVRLRIARCDPFGLLRHFTDIPLGDSLLVLPRQYPLGKLELPDNNTMHRGQYLPDAAWANILNDGEFLTLRDYRHGDPMRAIHWRSYARHGNLLVREYETESIRNCLLVVDNLETARPECFERLLSAAASLLQALPVEHTSVCLLELDGESKNGVSGEILCHLAHMKMRTAKLQDTVCQTIAYQSDSGLNTICLLAGLDAERLSLLHQLSRLNSFVVCFIIADPPPDSNTLRSFQTRSMSCVGIHPDQVENELCRHYPPEADVRSEVNA